MAKMEDVWDDASEGPLDKDTRVHLSHLFKVSQRLLPFTFCLPLMSKTRMDFERVSLWDRRRKFRRDSTPACVFQQRPCRDEARRHVGYREGMREGMRWGTSQGILMMYQALAPKGDPPVAFPEVKKKRLDGACSGKCCLV